MQLGFDNFVSADELFATSLQSLESYVLINNNLCGKLLTIVLFSFPDFNLFGCELDNFTFKVLYWFILL